MYSGTTSPEGDDSLSLAPPKLFSIQKIFFALSHHVEMLHVYTDYYNNSLLQKINQ